MQRLSLSLAISLIVGVSASSVALANTEYKFSPAESSAASQIIAKKSSFASQFVAVEHPTQGQAQVIEEDGQKYLEFGADFQSDRGPDLKVILHKADAVDLKVEEGDYVNLGKLQSVKGAQRYLIPESVDLAQYQSVGIWCEKFNATFGYAPLAQ